MWKEIDRAGVEAILGKGITWTEEAELDMTFLADRMCAKGLTASEQVEYEALQALYCSGR
jgi:hypothetical protein